MTYSRGARKVIRNRLYGELGHIRHTRLSLRDERGEVCRGGSD